MFLRLQGRVHRGNHLEEASTVAIEDLGALSIQELEQLARDRGLDPEELERSSLIARLSQEDEGSASGWQMSGDGAEPAPPERWQLSAEGAEPAGPSE